MEGAEVKVYRSAEELFGRCDEVPGIVSGVQFFGVSRTKRDALIKEVAGLYVVKNLRDLLRSTHIAAAHMMEMGLFDSIQPLVDVSGKNGDSYEVTFVVKEPGAFRFSVRANCQMPSAIPELMLNVDKKSIFGRGEAANVSYSMTNKGGATIDLAARKPFLGWQKYSHIGMSLFRGVRELEWNNANLTENGLVFHYHKRHPRNLYQSVRLNTIWRKFMPKKDTPFPVREHAGHTSKISLEHDLAFDVRDRPLIPTKGLLLKHTIEYAGLLGDSAFLRNSFNFQVAAPLVGNFFMGASLSSSIVQAVADRSIHLLDRVYLGGPFNLRGFRPNSIGTRAESSSLGGAFSLAGVLHLYHPLPWPKDTMFAHGFLAAGSVCSVRSRQWLKDVWETPRISAGVGLVAVWGPIRLELNYALPLRFMFGDQISPGLQFGIGVDFS